MNEREARAVRDDYVQRRDAGYIHTTYEADLFVALDTALALLDAAGDNQTGEPE